MRKRTEPAMRFRPIPVTIHLSWPAMPADDNIGTAWFAVSYRTSFDALRPIDAQGLLPRESRQTIALYG